ncbi:MAG: class I SAM-dependent methyltransferase [Chlorobiaceae bacterium]
MTETIDGFEAWAPEIAKTGTGKFFHLNSFKKLAVLEDANFWFNARNELLIWALNQYFVAPAKYAEIGCGTGYVLRAVEQAFPEAEIVGTELFVEGLKFAAQRCSRSKLVQLDARAIPYRNQFDVVGIFDVLEHIEDDEAVLKQIEKSLVNGGGVLITVPQHQWLWSSVDEAACHVRRYSAKELAKKVKAAGFEIMRSTSFVSLLLPMMVAARFVSRNKPTADASAELSINKHLNWLFRKIMADEFNLIKLGLNFTFGGSRLLIARKNSK